MIVALALVALGAVFSRRIGAAERMLWLLIAAGWACVAIPEIVYLRDSFDGGPFERMNTIFKFGYQGWVLLAIAAACVLPWAGAWLGRRTWPVWAAGTAVALLLGAVYPYAGTYARKNAFRIAPTLDGLGWLRERAPGDPAAIDWLRAHSPGDAVVLEGFGPDYSAFGHAPHLDVHRPPDRARLGGPRAAVEPSSRARARRTSRRSTRRPTTRRRSG